MMESHTDHGTVLQPDEAVLVWSPTAGFKMHVPRYDDDEDVPKVVQFLAAVMMRAGEAEYIEDMVKWFGEQAS